MKILKEELRKYSAYYSKDNEFSSFCRYLQSKWRTEKGYPMDKKKKYGNYLDLDFAKRTKNNYLTPRIKELVTKEVENSKQNEKLISEPRIWNNLLSSQPLCFNLFGELHYDLVLATRFFQNIYPDIISKVLKIDFEYSPGRENIEYTGDRSAFDVFIEYLPKNLTGKGFLGIEVKYIEDLTEESKKKAEKIFKKHKDRYTELTEQSGIFKKNRIDELRKPPISQIWRDHLLALATIKDYNEGYFVFLSPENNLKCNISLDNYYIFLNSNNYKENKFRRLSLEKCVYILEQLIDDSWVKDLKLRYIRTYG